MGAIGNPARDLKKTQVTSPQKIQQSTPKLLLIIVELPLLQPSIWNLKRVRNSMWQSERVSEMLAYSHKRSELQSIVYKKFRSFGSFQKGVQSCKRCKTRPSLLVHFAETSYWKGRATEVHLVSYMEDGETEGILESSLCVSMCASNGLDPSSYKTRHSSVPLGIIRQYIDQRGFYHFNLLRYLLSCTYR